MKKKSFNSISGNFRLDLFLRFKMFTSWYIQFPSTKARHSREEKHMKYKYVADGFVIIRKSDINSLKRINLMHSCFFHGQWNELFILFGLN